MVIRIIDLVETCNTASDGERVYRALRNALSEGREVFLSFDSVSEVPSSFVNAAIVRLFEDFDQNFLRSHLRMIEASAPVAEMVVRCMRNGMKRLDNRES